MGSEWYQRTFMGGRSAKEINDDNPPNPPERGNIFCQDEVAICCHYDGILPSTFLKYGFRTAV